MKLVFIRSTRKNVTRVFQFTSSFIPTVGCKIIDIIGTMCNNWWHMQTNLTRAGFKNWHHRLDAHFATSNKNSSYIRTRQEEEGEHTYLLFSRWRWQTTDYLIYVKVPASSNYRNRNIVQYPGSLIGSESIKGVQQKSVTKSTSHSISSSFG